MIKFFFNCGVRCGFIFLLSQTSCLFHTGTNAVQVINLQLTEASALVSIWSPSQIVILRDDSVLILILYTFKHLECPVGYTGTGCNIPCYYPSFGLFCAKFCNCSRSECDKIRGCRTGKFPHLLYETIFIICKHVVMQDLHSLC